MSIENWLVEELRFSRSYYQPWGRRVIYAIDVDDCVLLAKIFQRKKGNQGVLSFDLFDYII